MSFSASVTLLDYGQPGLWRCSNPASRPGTLSYLLLPLHEPLHGQPGKVPLYLHPPHSVRRALQPAPVLHHCLSASEEGPDPAPLLLVPLLLLFCLPSSQWPLCCCRCHRWGHLPPRKERVSDCCVLLLGPCGSTVLCPSCGAHILQFWVQGLMYTPEVSSSGFSPFFNICSVLSNHVIPILTFSYLHVDPVSSWCPLSSAWRTLWPFFTSRPADIQFFQPLNVC